MPAPAPPGHPAGLDRPRPRFTDGSFEDWVRYVEEQGPLGVDKGRCTACTDREAAARVVDFELSGRAAPSRERWDEEAVLRAMRSESAEPSFEDFYNRGLPIDEPLPVPRYSLAELGGWESGRLASLLRSGVPVVITDAYASLPDFFKYSWTCEDFERRFEGLPGHTSLELLYRGDGVFEVGRQSFADFFRLLEGGPLYWGPKSRTEELTFLSPLLRNDEGVFGLPPDVTRTSCFVAESPEFWFQRTADDRAPEAGRPLAAARRLAGGRLGDLSLTHSRHHHRPRTRRPQRGRAAAPRRALREHHQHRSQWRQAVGDRYAPPRPRARRAGAAGDAWWVTPSAAPAACARIQGPSTARSGTRRSLRAG